LTRQHWATPDRPGLLVRSPTLRVCRWLHRRSHVATLTEQFYSCKECTKGTAVHWVGIRDHGPLKLSFQNSPMAHRYRYPSTADASRDMSGVLADLTGYGSTETDIPPFHTRANPTKEFGFYGEETLVACHRGSLGIEEHIAASRSLRCPRIGLTAIMFAQSAP